MSTVVGLYSSLADAQETIADLIGAGFSRQRVSFVMRSQSVIDHAGISVGVVVDDGSDRTIVTTAGNLQRVIVAGPLAAKHDGAQAHGAEWNAGDALRGAGLGPFAANRLEDAICAGAIVVAVHCEDRRMPMARDVLDIRSLSEIPSAPMQDHRAGATDRANARSTVEAV